MRVFLKAVIADSEKSCFIVGNLTIRKISGNIFKTLINMFAENIHHSAAAGTHKVTMRSCAGIESVCSAKTGKLLYLTQISKKREVPVYGTKADIWIDLLHILINKISCGMVGSACKKFFDRFSLAAVFQCGHLFLLSLNNSNYY